MFITWYFDICVSWTKI